MPSVLTASLASNRHRDHGPFTRQKDPSELLSDLLHCGALTTQAVAIVACGWPGLRGAQAVADAIAVHR